MCVDEVKKSSKKKRNSSQSTHSIDLESLPPQPTSASSVNIDSNMSDANQPTSISPLPSPSITSVQSNISIQSQDLGPISNDITRDFPGNYNILYL